MSKQVMISIKPEHAVNILKGIKTLELRTWHLGDYVGWVNVYVSKGKPFITMQSKTQFTIRTVDDFTNVVNGKVAFRFWYDGYEKLTVNPNGYVHLFDINRLCLTQNQIDEYGKGKDLYAWHINKLEIFDKPKDLSEFLQFYGGEESFYELKKAPQSWQYVYVEGE